MTHPYEMSPSFASMTLCIPCWAPGHLMFGGEATSSAAGIVMRFCISGALFQIKWGLRGLPFIDNPQEDVTVPLAHLAGVSVAA